MARRRARPVSAAEQRRRAKARQVTQALDDLGYLADTAYRPHVTHAIAQLVWPRRKQGR